MKDTQQNLSQYIDSKKIVSCANTDLNVDNSKCICGNPKKSYKNNRITFFCSLKCANKYKSGNKIHILNDEQRFELNKKRYCQCGCGEILKINKYHILYKNIPLYKGKHWLKDNPTKGFSGKHHSIISKKIMSEKSTINMKNPEIWKKVSDGIKLAHINNPEYRKILSFKSSGDKNPSYGKIYYPKIIKDNRLNHIVRSSWELSISLLFIDNNINYEYEYKTFKLNNSTYTPDFYLPDYNLYIEVKGPVYDKQIIKMKEFVEKYNINFLIIGNKRILKYFNKHNFYPKIIDYEKVNINEIISTSTKNS